MAGRYRLRERQGGWAGSLLWIAEDEELGRPVIVWVFPPGFGRVRAVVAAARAACQLDDPRLTRIFDADDRGQRPYVVTERPVGSHLGELVAAARSDPGHQVAGWSGMDGDRAMGAVSRNADAARPRRALDDQNSQPARRPATAAGPDLAQLVRTLGDRSGGAGGRLVVGRR